MLGIFRRDVEGAVPYGLCVMLLLVAEHFLRQVHRAVFALLEGAAHVFADDADADELHGAQGQDQHDDGGVAGDVDAEGQLLEDHPQQIQDRSRGTAGLVIGYRLDEERYRIRLNDPGVVQLDYPVEVDGTVYACSYVELGSPGIPHAVIPMTHLRETANSDLLSLGRALRYHSAFPKGANINFYEIIGPNRVYIKTYERGVEDFTYACGTGTGSTVYALFRNGLTDRSVIAEMRGGELAVDVDMNHDTVKDLWLTGPTNVVARGEITDKNITF